MSTTTSSSSTMKLLVRLIIGFILFTSILFVQYYFQFPCPKNGINHHPFSSAYNCLLFLSSTTAAANKSRYNTTSSIKYYNILGNKSLEEHGSSISSPPGRRRQPSSEYYYNIPPPPAPPPTAVPQDNSFSPRISYNLTQISPPPSAKGVELHPPAVATAVAGECNVMLERSNSSELVAATKKGEVISIATMNNILLQNYASSPAVVLQNSQKGCMSNSDQELLEARLQIEKAPVFSSGSSSEGLYAPIYWNISRFKRSYELMEKTLKVYIYREGSKPIFHHPNLKGIYASEGWFMKQMEANNQYITTNPTKAHLFYFPFSSQMLEQVVYIPNSHSFDRLKQYLANYLHIINTKYPFWNRTSGADHFLVACHDWAPEETRRLMANCIRALCNADIKEGFQLGKDVSLPETLMPPAKELLLQHRGQRYYIIKNPPIISHDRKFLAFFAGNMHGYLRPILLKYWGTTAAATNKDHPEMKIFGRMQKSNYIYHMKNSKFCICARGYEVNSPRLVESIMYGCVPVIISDNFVPPFLEVLNWEKIAVFVPEKEIPELKNILLSISERRYRIMQHRVKMVRRHFLWHPTMPEKYDIFHMILHSIWYNRVFQITHH